MAHIAHILGVEGSMYTWMYIYDEVRAWVRVYHGDFTECQDGRVITVDDMPKGQPLRDELRPNLTNPSRASTFPHNGTLARHDMIDWHTSSD